MHLAALERVVLPIAEARLDDGAARTEELRRYGRELSTALHWLDRHLTGDVRVAGCPIHEFSQAVRAATASYVKAEQALMSALADVLGGHEIVNLIRSYHEASLEAPTRAHPRLSYRGRRGWLTFKLAAFIDDVRDGTDNRPVRRDVWSTAAKALHRSECAGGGGRSRPAHRIGADASPGDFPSNSAMTSRTTRTAAPLAEPISLQEAASRLGVHYMTAYRYVRTGRLPARRDGAQWFVDPRDLDRMQQQDHARPAGRRAKADRTAILTARMTAGDEAGAWRVIDDALASGMDPAGVYLGLLVPVLRGVGAGWAAGTVTIAAEHRASAVALRIIGRLGPQFARRGRKRGIVIIGAPAGDQHSLPGAIVADLLRGEGFEVIDLGANTPDSSFAETAQDATRLVAVVIGVTAPGSDSAVQSIVQALRRSGSTVPVLIGGAAINGAEHALRLGADAWTGPDGQSVITAVNAAAARRRSGPASAPRAG